MKFKNLKDAYEKKKAQIVEWNEKQKLKAQVKAEKRARALEKQAQYKQQLAERKIRAEKARQKTIMAQKEIAAAQEKTRNMQPKSSFNFRGMAPTKGSSNIFGDLGLGMGGGDMFAGSPFASQPKKRRKKK